MIGQAQPAPADLLGGRYRLVGRLGSGGMGDVWLAHDVLLDRDVAVKRVLAPDRNRQRAVREARAAARIAHPHAVTVFDVVDDAEPWIVMEHFPSQSVSDLLRASGPLPAADALRITAQVADALAQAHARGVIHRDVKPGNILIATDDDRSGLVKIADFGIARAVGDPTITGTGILTGTPAYFAPETARGEEPGPPADVYALGATLHTMLVGAPPHGDDENYVALLHRIARGTAPAPVGDDALDDLLGRILDPEPARRPTMAATLDLIADRAAASTPGRLDTAGGPVTATAPAPHTLAPVPARTPTSTPQVRRSRYVPSELTSFIGRTAELADLTRLVDAHRMVTVAGAGGVGKTRLVQRFAVTRVDPDGPWFVDLAGAATAVEVTDALLSVLGIATVGGLDTVVEHLSGRSCLLVLDRCEHLLDPIGAIAHRILQACPDVRILASSRGSLGVPGEVRMALSSPADTVDLFLERSPVPVDASALDDVRRLCAAVGNLPLAVELAAARTRLLSIRQILDGLGGGGDLLAVIDESFCRLRASRRDLLTDLSVFDGGFDFDAITAVTGRGFDVIDDLAVLVDQSLVVVTGGDPRRYRLLDTVRQFAADRLDGDRRATLVERRRDWAQQFAADAFAGLRGPESVFWMRRVDHDLVNVRAVLEECRDTDPETYARIVGGLYWFWYRRGRVDEGVRLVTPAVESERIDDDVAVRAVVGRALLGFLAADVTAITAAGVRLAAVAEALGEAPTPGPRRTAAAEAWAMLAYIAAGADDVAAVRTSADRARRFAAAEGLDWTAAEVEIALSEAARRDGDAVAARGHLDRLRATAERHGYDWLLGSALWLTAKNELRDGGAGSGPRRDLLRMIDVCERTMDLTSWMVGVATLAYAEFVDGRHDRAALLLGIVARRTDETGFVPAGLDMVEFVDRMRTEIPADILDDGDARGRALDREAVGHAVTGT